VLIKDLHQLPKMRDRIGHLYVERGRIDQQDKAIAIHDVAGITPVPCASLALLMLGPGTSITHAAITALADNGCLVVWCGEEGVRFYAAGHGTTRSSERILWQAALLANEDARMRVVRRLYTMRFKETLSAALTLQQLRGMEGVRVRDTYAKWSRETGVPWNGRCYDRSNWANGDPVNRALSSANACLYGLSTAAITAAGFSPALGFIHTGKQLSFAYDVADLYKMDLAVPAAFMAVADGTASLERQVRLRCRDFFARERFLDHIVRDIERALELRGGPDDSGMDSDTDPAMPGNLWDPEGPVAGGQNQAPDTAENEPQADHNCLDKQFPEPFPEDDIPF
jgi:CRISPR-associated protein Cas1